jgi:hypothetical protein
MRPPAMATSPVAAGIPLPSQIVPPRRTKSARMRPCSTTEKVKTTEEEIGSLGVAARAV